MANMTRGHRRQHSALDSFETISTSTSLADQLRHIRGASNTGTTTNQHQQSPQEHQLVGILTNPGQQQLQHGLQVAQQQSRKPPGQPTRQLDNNEPRHNYSTITEEEFRILQHQQLDAQLDTLINGKSFQRHTPWFKMEKSRSDTGIHFGSLSMSSQDNSDLQNSTFGSDWQYQRLSTSEEDEDRPKSSRSMYGTPRKSPSSCDWLLQLQKPFDPSKQGSQGRTPMTPEATPQSRRFVNADSHSNQQLSSKGYDFNATLRAQQSTRALARTLTNHSANGVTYCQIDDPDATIKPRVAASAASENTTFADFFNLEPHEPQEGLPSPPSTSPVRTGRQVDMASFPNTASISPIQKLAPSLISNKDLDDRASKYSGGEGLHTGEHSNRDNETVPARSVASSRQSARSSVDWSEFGSPIKAGFSPTGDFFDDLGLEATIEDTGVTADDVAAYMSEDMSEPKCPWTCTYPECGKRFGRRENIRSHIQTHLNDRQFKCLHCSKRFVRQHDLKRHSKIHTGAKPYPCACGTTFARHDALTRHRQRGICKGSFEGIVRTPVKRGRPRKTRLDNEERHDKAMRTRQRAAAKKSYASSISATSESSFSANDSPIMPDHMDTDDSAFSNMPLFNGEGDPNFTFSPGSFAYTPPMSPSYSTGNVSSPRKTPAAQSIPSPPSEDMNSFHLSDQQNQTPVTVSMAEMSHEVHHSIGSYQGSQPGSPPGLSHSSPPSSAQLLDCEMVQGSFGDDEGNKEEQELMSRNDLTRLLEASSEPGPWSDQALFAMDKNTSVGDMNMLEGFGDQPLFEIL